MDHSRQLEKRDEGESVFPTKDGFESAEEQEYFVCWELQRLTHCLNPHAKRNARIAIIAYFAMLGIAIVMLVIAIVSALIMDDLNNKMTTANNNMEKMYGISDRNWKELIAGGQLVQLNNFWMCEFFVMLTVPNLVGFLWNNGTPDPFPRGRYTGKRWPCCPVEAQEVYPGGCQELFNEVENQWAVQNS